MSLPNPSVMGRAKSDLTIAQKLRIREWVANQEPRPPQRATLRWIAQEFGVELQQSTLSKILSNKLLESLDIDSDPGLENKRIGQAQWPQLEKLLFDWQQATVTDAKPVSHDALMRKALELWETVPEARNNEEITPDTQRPVFGKKWCEKFQKRWKISRRTPRGESNNMQHRINQVAQTAAHNVTLQQDLEKLQKLRDVISTLTADEVYNFDHTGLHWRRLAPSVPRIGTTRARAGHFRIGLCTNITGTDKLPLWLIGTESSPKALRDFNLETHRAVWHANQTSWFAGHEVKLWLQSFYEHIQDKKPGKRILLIMQDLPAHRNGLREAPPPENISVEFLPTTVAPLFQPIDMGVIVTVKRLYRQHYLQWLCTEFRIGNDPFKQLSLRHAVWWLFQAWFMDLQNTTIRDCWLKSTLLSGLTHYQLAGIFKIPSAAPSASAASCIQLILPKLECTPENDGLQELYSQATQFVPAMNNLQDFLLPEGENDGPQQPDMADDSLDALEDDAMQWEGTNQTFESHNARRSGRDARVEQPQNQAIDLSTAVSYIRAILDLSQQNDAFRSADIVYLEGLRRRLIAVQSQQPLQR